MMGLLVGLGVKLVEVAGGYIHKKEDAKAEWELEAVRASAGSWKDEWLTVVFTLPLVVQIVGSVAYALGYGTRLLEGGRMAIDNLENLGIPYGPLSWSSLARPLGSGCGGGLPSDFLL